MSRILVKKGNIDRSDFNRAVLTDTSPEDIPIVVSNDGLHANLVREEASPRLTALVDAMVRKNRERYTIPYRYRIRLSRTASRQLSLMHPAAQKLAADFYGEFGHMIPYFCRHDAFSLRRPSKIGSSVSRKTMESGKKRLKGSAIDTMLQDQTVRNPGSFFAYEGYDRFYKFFGSPEFISLERRFSLMRLTDVSKCFTSIYSHTIAWAVKDVLHGKESNNARSFANLFDDLMQYSNYNETNGIPVGPEVSRLFAEVILQSVDVALVRYTKRLGLIAKRDFEVRRYIDDYAIFANSPDTADAVQRGLEETLGVFNLHLNDSKTYTVSRPLQTKQSRVISHVDRALDAFAERLFSKLDNGRGWVPLRVRNVSAVVGSLVNDIKVACADSGSGYEQVSPYVVGSIANRVERLIESQATAGFEAEKARAHYLPALQVLVETLYFFLTVHMTVRASYQVAKTTILVLRFVRDKLTEASTAIQDTIRAQIEGIMRDPVLASVKMSAYVPVEILNIVLAASELSLPFAVDTRLVVDRVLKEDHIDYFSYVSLIFYHQANDADFTKRLESRLKHSFLPNAQPRQVSRDAHLMLDLITCPYLTGGFRISVLQKLHSELQLPIGTLQEQQALLLEMENNPWFVNWKQIDLLNHLRKKELSAIY